MTEQEAMEIIMQVAYDGEFPLNSNEGFSVACKALEKQIPKNVIFVHPLQKDDNGDYMCPSCKSGTVYDAYGNKPSYCHYCGQAIKWE